MGTVWSTTTQTRVNNTTAVTLSVKCFNPLKLYPLSGNIFKKRFALYFFIYSRAFNKYWSSTVNLIAVTAVLLMSWSYRCNKKYLTNRQIIFIFLSCVSILTRDVLTRDIDIAILSVRPSVRPSVRDVPVSDENGLTYRHHFFTIR